VEIPKSEHAYADADEWNVDLEYRMANVTSVCWVGLAGDKRHSGAMILQDSVLKGRELLASVLRIFDSIRAWNDVGKQ
jgi:hypothetical protein